MKNRAFTLIELSIVLVIIGLIVGGVLVGQDLIRAAELREVPTTVGQLETAVNAFKLKYNCIPGDCRNATTFGFTGNGDGDKIFSSTAERFRFWQHLADAGMWEGTYTGVQGAGGYADCSPGSNCPKLKIGGGKVTMIPAYLNYTDPNNGMWWITQGNYLFLGADHPIDATLAWPLYPFLRGHEALQIDEKFDNGRAGTGKYISSSYAGGYGHSCEVDAVGSSTSVTAANIEAFYRTDTDTLVCSFIVKMPF